MSSQSDDRPIFPAYAVKDGDGIVFIHLERGPAEAIAARTHTHPNRRVVEIWVREKSERSPV
jgi:hypothetical protein